MVRMEEVWLAESPDEGRGWITAELAGVEGRLPLTMGVVSGFRTCR